MTRIVLETEGKRYAIQDDLPESRRQRLKKNWTDDPQEWASSLF
jgi:hypothetical protein